MRLKIEGDKQKHIIVGALIAAVTYASAVIFWPGHIWLPVVLAIGATTLIGFGFELFSLITRIGHAEWMDGIATVAGGVIGVVVGYVVNHVILLF